MGIAPNTARRHMLSGPFLLLGITPRWYLLVDASLQKYYSNWREFMYKYPGLASYQRLGYEFYKGMHLSLVGNFQADQLGKRLTYYKAVGPALNFYPRPHFEMSASWMKQQTAAISDGWQNLWNIMLHYYF